MNFPIPFDPDWVMMALGMTPYDPAGQYTVDVNEREAAYVLNQKTTTRQGQSITRMTVFNADYQRGQGRSSAGTRSTTRPTSWSARPRSRQ